MAKPAATNDLPILAITAGEPAGIGPEIIAQLARRHRKQPFDARLVVIGDKKLLMARSRRIGLSPGFVDYDSESVRPVPHVIEIWHHPCAVPVSPGEPNAANAHSVLRSLESAADACSSGTFAAIVTAPVQKSVMLDAGIPFSGHTEFFAQRTHTHRVVMLLVGGPAARPLRVALVTTHLALKDVPAAITRDAVSQTIAILADELQARFGIGSPRLAVCGLNPHAGEGGHLGREEIEVIAPALVVARTRGIDVTGPLPADTVFISDHAQAFDAIVAMYHDQGLPALKAASFGHGINVTLGLPFIRTSVDHGTALDLAVNAEKAATADPGSLIAAVELAIELAEHARA